MLYLRHCIALALVWLIALGGSSCSREEQRPRPDHIDDHQIIETKDLTPVIRIEDLGPLGLDTTTIYELEPHFSVLNDALVTLAELKRSYDAAATDSMRTRLNAYAVSFHITADFHQRAMLLIVPAPRDSVLDRYIEDRKREAGLADWHIDHREDVRTGELPGLVPSRGRRH